MREGVSQATIESMLQVPHLAFNDPRLFRELLGNQDEHLKIAQRTLGVKFRVHGTEMEIQGDPPEAELAREVMRQLYGLLERGYPVYGSDVDYAIRILSSNSKANLQEIFLDTIYISSHKRTITPKSVAQKSYIDAIRRHDIVFGIGPAGTGKTYLAMAMAVSELMKNNYARIILTRPAVEAGEKLGFLPGDLAEKVNPYLRPLYDAMHDMVDFDKARRLLERGSIEVAPLAFMRGRTLNDSFVILDEGQNTTPEQMKKFLTRLGLRLQGGDHRRRDPDRPARRPPIRAEGSVAHPAGGGGHPLHHLHREGRGPAPPGAGHHHRLRARHAARRRTG